MLRNKSLTILLVSLGVTFCVNLTESVSIEKFLTLNYEEKVALDKLKERVVPKLPHEYMKQDAYLLMWVRHARQDVDVAENLLLKTLKWRKERKIDTIHDEDFSDMEAFYPYIVKGRDKEGKPLVYIKFGEWNVRRSIIAGQTSRAMQYIDKMLDDGYRQVVKLRQEGRNATQYVLILDLDNYNSAQQGCVSCMSLFVYYTQTLQTHFPWSIDKSLIINAPAVFDIAMKLVRPILTQQFREATMLFGMNRDEWQKFFRTIIEPEQLLKDYGGTLELEEKDFR